MKKTISAGQVRGLIASFAVDVPWDKIEVDVQPFIELTPEQRGRMFAAFLRNGCRLVVGEPKTIKAMPFDLEKFLGKDCSIWKGSADGDGLSGEEDICHQSMAITEVELSKFVFRHCLKEGETSITGEEKIRRLNGMSNFIGFGPNIFLGLWEDYQVNKENSALEWLYRNFGVTFMDFPGVILRLPDGYRYVLYLYRNSDGEWRWDCFWLDLQWYAGPPSVGCAS